VFELEVPEDRPAHQLEVVVLSNDVVLIDDTDTVSAHDAVTSLKRVTQAARRERRVIAVMGALDFQGDSDYDNLPGFAAVLIRLNVSQLFAIGKEARAIYVSVGLEGSWDGESHHCLDIDQGYDDVRAFIQPGDVVLIMGSTTSSLFPLFSRLREALA
jgi:UDP-N-acetylmuramyl pentapeptide synthase